MPIYKYKNTKGITLYRVVYIINTINGPKQTTKRGFKTQKEAKIFEANEIAKNEKTTDMILSDLIKFYLKDKKIRVKNSTFKSYVFNCNAILREFKDIKFKDYNYQYFQNIFINLDKKKYKRYNYYLIILKDINKFAYKVYDIQNKDISKLEYFKVSAKKNYNIWSVKQFEESLKNIYKDRIDLKIYYSLLFFCGLRSGEALALTPNDFKDNTVNITKTRTPWNNAIQSPKTKASIRKIVVPNKLINTINEFIKSQNLNDNDFLFLHSYTYYQRNLNKIINQINLPKITLHDLRHSHASMLFENNMPISAISKRLGHRSITMTLETYTHMTKLSNDTLNEFIEKI